MSLTLPRACLLTSTSSASHQRDPHGSSKSWMSTEHDNMGLQVRLRSGGQDWQNCRVISGKETPGMRAFVSEQDFNLHVILLLI